MACTVKGANKLYVTVSIPQQTLRLLQGKVCLQEFSVSTARNGGGELHGSECTPRGWHIVRAKIGAGCGPDTVFVGRRPTGERYDSELQARYPGRDWILTRILWLSGVEIGRNRFGKVDTMRRYIYIHGCPDTVPMGVPGSHGCIRMRNPDVVELFERIEVGTCVRIDD
ncbi:MAG: L,D-transpeptidase family protein [Gammaproteobacteria bacterium]